jgi:hypothetical protein
VGLAAVAVEEEAATVVHQVLVVVVALAYLVKVLTDPLVLFLLAVLSLEAVGVLAAVMVHSVQAVHMVVAEHLPLKSLKTVAEERFVLFGVLAGNAEHPHSRRPMLPLNFLD